MRKIFVPHNITDPGVEQLQEAFGVENVRVYREEGAISRELLLEGVVGVSALLPIQTERVDGELLDAAGPQLKVVANHGVGYDNIDVEAATARNVVVTNTPGVVSGATADLTWSLILSAARRTCEADRYVREGKWNGISVRLLNGTDVHGKTLGIFGLGSIGQAVARRSKGFDMPLIYHSRNRLDAALERDLGARYVDKATLLAESDILSLHCPLTPETTRAFGEAEFCAMKSSAVFINTTRGPVVDEAALAHALLNGEIACAGLDVFEAEPKIHPDLLRCENAVFMPHLGSASHETRGKMGQMAAVNIIACLNGQVQPNCLNKEVLGAVLGG